VSGFRRPQKPCPGSKAAKARGRKLARRRWQRPNVHDDRAGSAIEVAGPPSLQGAVVPPRSYAGKSSASAPALMAATERIGHGDVGRGQGPGRARRIVSLAGRDGQRRRCGGGRRSGIGRARGSDRGRSGVVPSVGSRWFGSDLSRLSAIFRTPICDERRARSGL
jgi:hypothetical protein